MSDFNCEGGLLCPIPGHVTGVRKGRSTWWSHIAPGNPAKAVIAKSASTGLGYVDVDWSTKATGYVRVTTVNGSTYIVRLSNVIEGSGGSEDG